MKEQELLVDKYTALIELVYENGKDVEQTRAILNQLAVCVLQLPNCELTNKPPPPPKAPLARTIRTGTIGDCPKCHSTTVKRFVFFGQSIGCIQDECDNYYKK